MSFGSAHIHPYSSAIRNHHRLAGGSAAPSAFLSYAPATDTIAGKGGTFTRAGTGATYWDVNGVVTAVSANVARESHYFNGEKHYVHELAATNLCPNSDNLSAWTAVNAPTLTSGQADIYGTTIGYKLADSGGTVQGVKFVPTFTGNAVKAITVHIKKGTTCPNGGHQIVVRDTTAVADRLRVLIHWNNTTVGISSGTFPTISTITGQLLKIWPLTNGWYSCWFATTSITAANGHEVELDGAAVAAETGDMFFGGVQVEDAACPSMLIPTSAATASRAADALSFPHGMAVTAPTSMYMDLTDNGLLPIGSGGGFHVNIGTGSAPHQSLLVSGSQLGARLALSANNDALVTGGNLPGEHVEWRGSGDATPNSVGGLALINATETTATTAAAGAYGAAWSGANVVFARTFWLKRFKMFAGAQTMSTMQTPVASVKLLQSFIPPTNIVVLGDSIAVGTNSSLPDILGYGPLARGVEQVFYSSGSSAGGSPGNGRGIILAQESGMWGSAGTWTTATDYGPFGAALQSSVSGSTRTVAGLIGDSFDIHYVQTTTTAQFTVQIDSETAVNVGGPTGSTQYTVTNVASTVGHGPHTVVITSPAANGLIIFWGVSAINNGQTTGMRLHRVGQSGAKASDMANAGASFSPLGWLTKLSPALTVISFGTNEYETQQAVGTYTTALNAIAAAATAAGSKLLFMSECPDGNVYATPQSTYVAALQAVATANGGYFLDIYNRTGWGGSYATAFASGFMNANLIHPADLGYADMATALESVIK